jgi:hypothetical protein
MKFLVVNSKEPYVGKLNILREQCSTSGLVLDLWDAEDKSGLLDYAVSKGYSALIHRNEHGRLFADGSLGWIKQSVNSGLPVLSLDFGYLDHYKTFMFDYYRKPDLSSGIHDEWANIPDKVDWRAAPKYVRQFRESILEKVARADNSKYAGKVGVWMQWNTNLLRPELGTLKQWKWVNLVCKKVFDLGLEPIVKMGIVDHSEIYRDTTPKIDPRISLVCDKQNVSKSNQRADFDGQANWKMVAGCSYHIILCSSVSHIMALTDKPVIATGQSWFNALGVFQEPVEWDSPLVKPEVNFSSRAKWINWWLKRQCQWGDSANKLIEVYELAKLHLNSHSPT